MVWGGINIDGSTGSTRAPSLDFERLILGPSVCGSPAEVADRILGMREALGLDLHIAMFDHGGMPEKLVFETLELFGARVLPELVRA
jgi:alkanesulfonate monooxygenase SsuD/methylene tetrahydromethanopterin reductase-like flavin-dependent oxidoreductase (luciferase family)